MPHISTTVMSALCQKRTSGLLDHRRAATAARRDRLPYGLEVDHRLVDEPAL